jgi:hypothetical protein
VKLLNGKAREIATLGHVRREVMRGLVQVLLLAVAVPSLFSDRDISLTPALAALMAVPVLLLLQSYLDARERRLLTLVVARETRR